MLQGSIANCYAALPFPALGRLPVYKPTVVFHLLLRVKEPFPVLLHGADSGDTEVLNKNLRHIRA